MDIWMVNGLKRDTKFFRIEKKIKNALIFWEELSKIIEKYNLNLIDFWRLRI